MSRSPSSASDRYSTVSGLTSYFPSNPTNIRPTPAYVAKSGAQQVVSEHRMLTSQWESDEEDYTFGKQDMAFSEPALALVNAFLDQLLYSFLSQSRSTSLSTLRPAVAEVLKQRLAREAIASAEEELQEMLEGGEDEEEDTNNNANGGKDGNYNRAWDLELVWKRTRLRVMVYMRLGEMEDDDEERYVKEEELFQDAERRFSHSNGLVSWAAAIFLTSILEYVAEQTLQTAGKAADSRAQRHVRAGSANTLQANGQTCTTVEEYDVEKVALSPTLGRLWRTWRKALRNNNAAAGGTHSRRTLRTPSRDNLLSSSTGRVRNESLGAPIGGESTVGSVADEELPRPRWDSVSTAGGMGAPLSTTEDPDVPDVQHPEYVLAANIPLPMGERERDVDEIEVPGLATHSDESEADIMPEPKSIVRRNSLSSSVPVVDEARGKERGMVQTEADQKFREQPVIKAGLMRKRSKSVPAAPVHLSSRRSVMPGAFPEEPDPSPTKSSIKDASPPTSGTKTTFEAVEEKPSEPKARKEAPPLPPFPKPATAPTESKTLLPRQGSEKFDLAATAPLKRKSHADLRTAKPNPTETTTTLRNLHPSRSAANLNDPDRRKSANPATALNWTIYGSRAKEGWNTSMPDLRAPSGRSKKSGAAEKDVEQQKAVVGQDVKAQRLSVPAASLLGHGRGRAGAGVGEVRSASADWGKAVVRDKSGEGRGVEEKIVRDKSEEGREMDARPVLNERSASGPQELEDTSVRGQGVGVAEASDRAGGVFIPGSTAQHARDGATPEKEPPSFATGSIAAAAATAGLAAAGLAGTAKAADDGGNESGGVDAFLKSRNLGGSGPSTPTESPRERTRSSLQVLNQSPRLANRDSRPGVPLTNGAQQSPAVFSSGKRQSWSAEKQAAVEYKPKWKTPDSPGYSKAGTISDDVKEHPILQRMSSQKRNEQNAALAALEKSNGRSSPALTSASIRDPEDFDMFVQGKDTVKYTLTPENVRDQPSKPATYTPSSLRSAGQANAGAESPTPYGRQNDSGATTARGRRPNSNHVTASSSTSIPTDPQSNPKEREKRRQSVSRPTPRNTSSTRHGQRAREPQVVTESTRDFADFIRSTGPSKEQEVTPVFTDPANRSTTSLASSMRSASPAISRSPSTVNSKSADDERTKSITRSAIAAGNAPPVPPMPNNRAKKSGMEARAANGSHGNGTNDLIDFIRSGPEQPAGEHRISRSVAPFRSTMDSEQFAAMDARGSDGNAEREGKPPLKLDTSFGGRPGSAGGKSANSGRPGAVSRSSAGMGETPRPQPRRLSNRDYMATRPLSPASLKGKPPQPSLPAASDSPEPSRKRYRNKDPYAIDISDEEEDENDLIALPPNQRRREESLLDFLNSHEPPADNGPRAVPPTTSRPASAPRKTSNSNNQSNRPSSRTSNSNTSHPTSPQATKKENPYRGPRMAARAAAASTNNNQKPTQGQAQAQAYNPNNTSAARRLGAFHSSQQQNPSSPGAANGAFYSETRELADFLRSSGPSSPAGGSAPAPPAIGNVISGPKEGGKVGKRGFWERFAGRGVRGESARGGKKTYLDMP
ncbi:hypothetical protein MBLNU230_g3955t1 [Neophaeotheca triangularis]